MLAASGVGNGYHRKHFRWKYNTPPKIEKRRRRTLYLLSSLSAFEFCQKMPDKPYFSCLHPRPVISILRFNWQKKSIFGGGPFSTFESQVLSQSVGFHLNVCSHLFPPLRIRCFRSLARLRTVFFVRLCGCMHA